MTPRNLVNGYRQLLRETSRKHSRFLRNDHTDLRNCMPSYSYVLKMVAAYSSETLVPNTTLRDATSQNTVISNRTVLKLLQQHNYKCRCGKIRNVISYTPVLGKFMFRISAGTRDILTSFFRGFLQSFQAYISISTRLVTASSFRTVSNSSLSR